jgi:hypothetical protein
LRLEVRLLLLRVLEGARLIVLRLAIAQMFSLVSLLYHSLGRRGNPRIPSSKMNLHSGRICDRIQNDTGG